MGLSKEPTAKTNEKVKGKTRSNGPSMNTETEEASTGKTKKMRVERATYWKEVEAEKNKGESAAVIDDTVRDLPMPHVPRSNTYVFSVLPFFHFQPPCFNLLR